MFAWTAGPVVMVGPIAGAAAIVGIVAVGAIAGPVTYCGGAVVIGAGGAAYVIPRVISAVGAIAVPVT